MSKINKFKRIAKDVPSVNTMEEAVAEYSNEEWILIDGDLYSKDW